MSQQFETSVTLYVESEQGYSCPTWRQNLSLNLVGQQSLVDKRTGMTHLLNRTHPDGAYMAHCPVINTSNVLKSSSLQTGMVDA